MDRSISHCSALGSSCFRRLLLVAGLAFVAANTAAGASEPCGTGTYPFPYTDVASVTDPFCPGIMEAYVTGISKGTTPTTFSPNNDVIRLQMTTFLQRTVDQVLTRGSRRAALKQWWTSQNANAMQTINLGDAVQFCTADGGAVWTAGQAGDVWEIQANTGAVTGPWSAGPFPTDILAAAGKIFVASQDFDLLEMIDPTTPPGSSTAVTGPLGSFPFGMAFDGAHIWTANQGGSVSIITLQATTPYPVNTVATGFNALYGILYDGANIWVTDYNAGTLLKLDPAGAILQTVTVGTHPYFPVFDGTNIWVPNQGDNSISVVQTSTGKVVATISKDASNQLSAPTTASFDGERILVTNFTGSSVTVFKAADLSFIANVGTGASTDPLGACSDGINFWVDVENALGLMRF